MRPDLHVQNVFDALAPSGVGVTGDHKVKALHRQNRSVALAAPGDAVVIEDTCPPDFVEYIFRFTGASDVAVAACHVDPDERVVLDGRAVMRSAARDSRWPRLLEREPRLAPYMGSSAIYEAAREIGLEVDDSIWETHVERHIVDEMSDKGLLHAECERLGAPVPEYRIATRDDLSGMLLEMLEDTPELYVRETLSSGGLGNITAKRDEDSYCVPEVGCEDDSRERFVAAVERFARHAFSDEFVVTELKELDCSPGTLFFCDDEGTTLCSHTDQVLSRGGKFLGFVYPLSRGAGPSLAGEMERVGRQLFEPWRKLGYRGYGNIDWMVTTAGELFVAERNARQTSVVAPLTVARGGGCGRGQMLRPAETACSARDFVRLDRKSTFSEVMGALEEAGIAWRFDEGRGVVVTLPPTEATGSIEVGLAAMEADPEAAEELLRRAADLLRCCGGMR